MDGKIKLSIMKGISVSILFVTIISLVSSCKKDPGVIEDGVNFVTESFDDFLWEIYVPDTIKAVINTQFEECINMSDPLVLQLCDDDANAIPIEVAQLYVNGQISGDNTISIVPSDDIADTEIWIVLDDSQIHDTRTFTWHLQVVDNPGLIKINDRNPSEDPWIINTEVNWRNNHVANSVRTWTDFSLLTVLAVLIVWVFLVQCVFFTRFKVSQLKRIFISVNGMRRNIQSYSSSVIGAKEIILTPVRKKQNIFSRLFAGKVVYVQIQNLFGEIHLFPGSGKFQTKANYDRMKYEAIVSGEMGELKILKSCGDTPVEVEFYAKRK